jgi:hypothetical protein
MAKMASGKVTYVGSKVFKGRTYWSFKIDSMPDDFFRTGLVEPNFAKGKVISFNYEVTQYGNEVDVASIVHVDTDSPPTAHVSPVAGKPDARADKSNPKDKYWEDKAKDDLDRQKIISYQAATNTAVAIIQIAISQDALPVAGKTKADKWESIRSLVAGVADDLVVTYMNAPAHVDSLVQEHKEFMTLEPSIVIDSDEVFSD